MVHVAVCLPLLLRGFIASATHMMIMDVASIIA